MNNYTPRKLVESVVYFLHFDTPARQSFDVPCGPEGQVALDLLHPAARENYENCLAAGLRGSVRKVDVTHWEPASGQCNGCHAVLVLDDPMTNRCDCGRFYNGSGQELCHPSLWGEETGERFDDDGGPIL